MPVEKPLLMMALDRANLPYTIKDDDRYAVWVLNGEWTDDFRTVHNVPHGCPCVWWQDLIRSLLPVGSEDVNQLRLKASMVWTWGDGRYPLGVKKIAMFMIPKDGKLYPYSLEERQALVQ